MKDMFENLCNKDAVKDSVANCSVALVGIKEEGNRHRASFVASGTFVEIASKKGILTAKHAIKKVLAESQQFVLSIQPREHHFAIQREEVHVIEVPKPDERVNGPDLAFVLLLPQDKLEIIQTHKYFFNLDKRRNQVLSEPLPAAMGFWILSGHPTAYSTSESLPAQNIDIKEFPNKMGICGIEREFTENGFDYVEAGIDHASGSGVPECLGGLSGGGLWQVSVSPLKNGQPQGLSLHVKILYKAIQVEE